MARRAPERKRDIRDKIDYFAIVMHNIRMWIERELSSVISQAFKQFPAILLTGARQVGKTTLLRRLFPEAAYLTLDDQSAAAGARSSPASFLVGRGEPLILDEIQYAPNLFRELKILIDRDRRPGRYVLTGSQSFPLMAGVSESLAGRCAILNLGSLSWKEVMRAGAENAGIDDYIFAGGYPELHSGTVLDRELWYSSYIATCLERDVRNVLMVTDLGDFSRFLRAVAIRTGQMLSYSELARDVGIAPNTAKKWVSVLKTSGHVYLLEPYHRNLGKRLIKTPKLFMADTGLAIHLMGFRDRREVLQSAYGGAIWETHVVNQIVRHYENSGRRPPIWYWRTPQGHEVDIVIEESVDQLIPVECKLSEHPDDKDTKGISAITKFYGKDKIARALIACRTSERYQLASGTWAIEGSDWSRELSI